MIVGVGVLVENKTVTKMNQQILYSFTVVAVAAIAVVAVAGKVYFQRIMTGKWGVTAGTGAPWCCCAGGGGRSGNDVN